MRSERTKEDALERFEQATSLPMLILSLAIIPLLLVPLIVDFSSEVETTFVALDWLIWAAFAIEYGIRLYLAPRKRDFVRHNAIDVVVIVLPFLRPLRVMRSARALRVLRAARGMTFLLRAIKASRDVLTRHKLHYALTVTMFLVIAGALLVEAFERGHSGTNITSIPDALWWAVATVTTSDTVIVSR
jgi:voltage-gated potassium channel